MAGGDKRGPRGMGPMTGRGLGYCAGNERPGFAPGRFGNGGGRGPGRGFGRGFGRGRGQGFGRFQQGPAFEAQEGFATSLADEVVRLKEQLKALETRLAEMDQKD